MKQSTINHKRLTRVVRAVVDYEVNKVSDYQWRKRHDSESVSLAVLEKELLPGIELVDTGSEKRYFVTINDEFLGRVGYDGNLTGFLADYFGSDAQFPKSELLKFRYLGGFLINPTIITKKEGV